MIARDMMPWLFVSRNARWTPYAKVRCEGGVCRWESAPATPRRERRPSGALPRR